MPKYLSPTETVGATAAPSIYRSGARNDLGRRITFAMLGVAVVLLIAGGGWIYLLNNEIQAVGKTQADRRAQIGSSQQIASRYAATLADYQATAGQLQFLEAPQPPDMYVPTLLPQIETLASEYRCQVKSITPGPLTDADPTPAGSGSNSQAGGSDSTKVTGPTLKYQTMPVNLSLSGSYPDVMHFVYDLTRFKKVVTVKSIELHPDSSQPVAGAATTAPMVNVNLVLAAYVFPIDDPSTATQSAAAGTATTTATAASSPAPLSIDHPMQAAMSVARESRADVKITGMSVQPPTSSLPFNPNLESSR